MRNYVAARRIAAVLVLSAFSVSCSPPGGEGGTYPHNIYLDQVVEDQWHPGTVGIQRYGNYMVDSAGVPIQNDEALGPPTGKGASSSGSGNETVGINGSAVFRFEEGWYIYDGTGDDFVTFQCNFAWSGACDGLCNELAHVDVSEDAATWYRSAGESYDTNPNPTVNDDGYIYANVRDLHGSEPTWANYQEDIQAQRIVDGSWVDIPGVYVSKYFEASDPYLGGTRFDLSNFRLLNADGTVDSASPWPAEGKMRYIRITDDSSILDGQDWNKDWCYGAHINAAMGINVGQDT